MFREYDIIVVGAGHAGCEAAYAAASMGSNVLLVTMDMNKVAQMSCNPAMGGVAKGQIVREIDAIGGLSGIISDATTIQFRMLNRSKGPAMWSPRSQNDRVMFSLKWREGLESNSRVDFWQDTVRELLIKDKRVLGIKTAMGLSVYAKAVVLTNGTFLNGTIHIGEKKLSGGRMGDPSSSGITEQLISLGFESGRMKTGTPPRVDGRSLDYSKMEEQPGDENPSCFSFMNSSAAKDQLPCWITYTSPKVHEILKEGFDQSPMYTGRIQGLGPRYCPSIEDKINRFAERERHQIFVEPEGRNTVEIYVNGFSTSLPDHIQYKALRAISGFENAKMFRPGYAIEYDYFPPTQLNLALETKIIENLYFAGQINGTTGYEEAASQGLMAGINACLKIQEKDPFVLGRSEAYIGVLIDDLITKGTEEPYRMFTSRAEYRILLRQDNADLRLTEKGYKLGLASEERMARKSEKETNIKKIIETVKKASITPDRINKYLESVSSSPIDQQVKLHSILMRPQVSLMGIIAADEIAKVELTKYDEETLLECEIEMKYESYINKEKETAEKLVKYESLIINDSFDYSVVHNLSSEAREKLTKQKPKTLGHASRISGVSPSDVSLLMVYLGR